MGGIQYAIFWKKMADSSQLIISLTLLLGNHAPKMTTKEKSKLKKISLKKLNQHINLFHFSADIGQVHHMFSRFLNLRFSRITINHTVNHNPKRGPLSGNEEPNFWRELQGFDFFSFGPTYEMKKIKVV